MGEELEAARAATTARPRPISRENRKACGVPEKATAQILVSRRDPGLAFQTVPGTSPNVSACRTIHISRAQVVILT
jgi:hypothetical protein